MIDPDRGDDLCFHVLVAADQLLIGRLKSLCEAAIADHVLTLRNAAQVFQFAVTYNATGLRDRVAQFLCLNIATLLEMKALDGLSREAMEVWGVCICVRMSVRARLLACLPQCIFPPYTFFSLLPLLP